MAIWKTYRISDVITEIADEKFVLPVIQRSLVWTEDKMELLFDTLLKGDSFGGVMVIEGNYSAIILFNTFAFRRFVFSTLREKSFSLSFRTTVRNL